MTKKTKIIIAATAVLIIVAGVLIWFLVPESSTPTYNDEKVDEIYNEKTEDIKTHYSETQIREMVTETAKEQFGDDAFIIFLSSEGPTKLEINGVQRNIYIYAADSRAEHDRTGKIRGLYHVDADTGEIFDNGSGKMEKIRTGE